MLEVDMGYGQWIEEGLCPAILSFVYGREYPNCWFGRTEIPNSYCVHLIFGLRI